MRLLLSVLTAQIATSIVIPMHLLTINERFYFFIETSVCRIMLHFTLQLNPFQLHNNGTIGQVAMA